MAMASEEPLVPAPVLQAAGPVTRQRVSLLENYDLTKITSELIDKGPKFSAEQVWPLRIHFGTVDLALSESLEREFKRFVALTLLRPGHIYAPSGPVDMYWHFFVLHTREYAAFCEAVWGGTVEHTESLPDDTDIPDVVKDKSHLALVNESAEQTYADLVPSEIEGTLTADQRQRLRKLAEWDLSYFTQHLVDRGRLFAPEQAYPIKAHFDGRCDIEITSQLEREFRRFVALTIIEPEVIASPSGLVDMYWHFVILHTEEYRKFCADVWGEFRHHPALQTTESNWPAQQAG